MTHHPNGLIDRVHAGLAKRQHLLGRHFDCQAAARQIAERYLNGADGTSGFWISRPRWTADGRIGVWDAVTFREGEEIADVLTTLSV